MTATLDQFVVIRASRIPLDVFFTAAHDHLSIDDFLIAWVDQSYVRQALRVASPSFLDRLDKARSDGAHRFGEFRHSVLKYLIRMTTRATPFGLFAGVGLATISDSTSLRIMHREADKRITRLDIAFLNRLRKQVATSRCDLPLMANPTVRQIGSDIHYTEGFELDGMQKYRLSSIVVDEFVNAALEAAGSGATSDEIASLLASISSDVSIQDAKQFAESMSEEGLIYPRIPLAITGNSPEGSLLRSLEAIGATSEASYLKMTIDAMSRMDGNPLDVTAAYEDALYSTKQLIPDRREGNLFQTDLSLVMESSTIDRKIFQDLSDAISLMVRDEKEISPVMGRFIEEFKVRHDGQFIPLLQAVDEQVGFSFGQNTEYENVALAGVPFPEDIYNEESAISAMNPLQQRLIEFLRTPSNLMQESIDLKLTGDKRNAERMKVAAYSFSILAAIHGEGEQYIHYKNSSGPSGMNLIGRFCHLTNDLLEAARSHLKREDQHSPDVIFAEIIHLPQGRAGNILARPRLSDFEIEFLGESSLPLEKRIGVDDIWLGVVGREVVLWSKRLKKRIVPRLSTAHNFTTNAMSPYKLLALIAGQVHAVPSFDLPRIIRNSRVIPRVMYGNVILSARRWCIPRNELINLTAPEKRRKAWLSLVEKYSLTPNVSFADRDNVLTVNLHSVPMVELLLKESRRHEDVTLHEVIHCIHSPSSEQISEQGSQKVVNEIVVPFTNEFSRPHRGLQPSAVRLNNNYGHIYAPGSEWICVKLYGAFSVLDSILVSVIASLVHDLKKHELISEFFYLRYADPDFHLRIRFKGQPSVLSETVLPYLNNALSAHLASRKVERIELFTYFPEYHRYGGEIAIKLAEQVFTLDSVATLALLRAVDKNNRWRIAILSSLSILDCLGFSRKQSLALVSKIRESFAKEFCETSEMRKQIGRRYRDLCCEDVFIETSTKQIRDHLKRSHEPLISLGKTYRDLDAKGLLTKPLADVAASFLHMTNNRIFITDIRKNEYAVYDFLRRYLLSESRRI
ncbi:lantibiotic dehydratase [Xanthomonas sp. NCPPB 2632]|uniref:lantibiotic dehydratase n=1 Tax=Xanthomonas sp. NCPPB 2632 TaxID=3240912 RepID=UPI003514452E